MPIHPLPLILASESKSRVELLSQTKFKFNTLATNLDESAITGTNPQERILKLAKSKAEAAYHILQKPSLILAADTFILFNNQILEKPKYKMTAVDMLKKLSGQIHTVITGWTLFNSYKNAFHTGTSTTYVSFRPLLHQEIVDYVNDNPVTQWAGGYNASLSSAPAFISKVEGSLTGLNGLPLDQIVPVIVHEYAHPYMKKNVSLLKGETSGQA